MYLATDPSLLLYLLVSHEAIDYVMYVLSRSAQSHCHLYWLMAAGKTRPFCQQGPTGLVYAAVAADQWLWDGEGITPLAVCLPPPPPPTVYLPSFIVPSAGHYLMYSHYTVI